MLETVTIDIYIYYIRYNTRIVLRKSNFHQIKLLPYNMGRGKH